MKKISILLLLFSLFILSACGKNKNKNTEEPPKEEEPPVVLEYNFSDILKKFKTPYNFTLKKTMIGAMNGTAFQDKTGSTIQIANNVCYLSTKLEDMYAKFTNDEISSIILYNDNSKKYHEHTDLENYTNELDKVNGMLDLKFLCLDNNDVEKQDGKLILTNLSKLENVLLTNEEKQSGITCKLNEATFELTMTKLIYYIDYEVKQPGMISKYKITYEFTNLGNTVVKEIPKLEKFYSINDLKAYFESLGYQCTPYFINDENTLVCTKNSDAVVFSDTYNSGYVQFLNLYYHDATPNVIKIIEELK